MSRWIKTKFKGVRYREHPSRKHGIRRDRYYTIRYKFEGKDREEKLGWESEWAKAEQIRKEGGKATGRSLEQEAAHRFSAIRSNQESGKGALTLKEQRAEEMAKRAAEAAELEAKAQEMITLAAYWQETYFSVAQRSKKACSWIKEQQHFTRWIAPIMGNMPLKSIKLEQWEELVKTLSNAGLTQRTQQYITGTLRRILKHACDRRLIDEAPPSGKRIGITGPGNNRRLRVITPEEEVAIMSELETLDPNAWRLARFAFLAGCRASEAINLVWVNIDSSRGCIVFPDTKNRDFRSIPLTPPLAELFSAMVAGRPDERVFSRSNGAPYAGTPHAFRTVVTRLGLNEGRTKRDRLVFHSIRHTVATRLARRLGPRDLMDVMGWRMVEMAMRYVHSNEDLKLKALAALGATPKTGKILEFQAKAATGIS